MCILIQLTLVPLGLSLTKLLPIFPNKALGRNSGTVFLSQGSSILQIDFELPSNLGEYFKPLRYSEIILDLAFIQGQIVGGSGGNTSLQIKFELYL